MGELTIKCEIKGKRVMWLFLLEGVKARFYTRSLLNVFSKIKYDFEIVNMNV